MRICLATTHFTPVPGGISNYYTCLSRLLTEAGHTVILLTIATNKNQTEDSIIDEGLFIKVTLAKNYQHYLRHYRSYFRPGSYAADEWIATGMAMRDWLLQHTIEYNIDLVETMDYGGAGIFMKQPGLPPLIIDAHSSALQIDREYPMHPDDHLAVIKKLELYSFKYADAIIAHSPMNLEEIRPMTLGISAFSPAPWCLPQPYPLKRQARKNSFLVISSLQMIKGAELMIRAAAIAGKTFEDICIYWAGEDSYSAPGGKLTSVYLQEKYPDTWGRHLVWLNQKNRNEVNQLMAETEAVLIPSLWDSFNYVVPETISSGTPLIVSDKTGAAYLVKDHPLAAIFRAGDAEALANLLIRFDDTFKQTTPGPSSPVNLNEYFSPEHIINDRMMVYQEILNKEIKSRTTEIKEALSFLESYTTPWRKYYLRLRKKIKTLIRPDFNNLNH